MKPIEFEGANCIYGAGQREYLPLPAYKEDNERGLVVTCWELNEEEIKELIEKKRLYVGMMTFNKPLQPLLVSTSIEELLGI